MKSWWTCCRILAACTNHSVKVQLEYCIVNIPPRPRGDNYDMPIESQSDGCVELSSLRLGGSKPNAGGN